MRICIKQMSSFIPVLSATLLAQLLGILAGLSFGIAANSGFNSAVLQSVQLKNPLAKWFLRLFLLGFHHFLIGFALMLFSVVYLGGVEYWLAYSLGLGLVLSELSIVQHLLQIVLHAAPQVLSREQAKDQSSG